MARAELRTRTKIFLSAVAAVALLGGGLAGGIALADHDPNHRTFIGGGVAGHRVASHAGVWNSTATNVWQNLPDARLGYSVASGSARLVTAEFNAMSRASGSGTYCSVRLVVRKSTSSTLTEMHPNSAAFYPFDNIDGAQFEANSINKSIKLGAGTWYFYVQVQAVGAGTTCSLTARHFQIDVHTA